MYVRLGACALAVALCLVPLGSAAAQQEPAAYDGQHLSDQPSDIQALFLATWSQGAAQEWVNERNAQINLLAVPQPTLLNPGMAGPQITIAQPSVGQTVWTAADFNIRGTITDPNVGPQGIDRVEVWLNGRRNTAGAVQVGRATLDGGGGWSLTFSPTKFPAMNSNLYVYGHSSYSGNTSVDIVNFNIVDRR
jgi:hypothetical protein